MRWKRKKRLNFKKVFFPSLVLPIILFIFLILRFNLFTIGNFDIQAKNINCANDNQIKDSSQIKGQNYFLIDSAKVENILKKKYFCIQSVLIAKYFPNKIKIQVFGRQPVAMLVGLKGKPASPSSWLENAATPSSSSVNEGFVVDYEGVIFSKAKSELVIPKVYLSNLTVSLGQKLDGEKNNILKIMNQIKTFGIEVQQGWVIDGTLFISPQGGKPQIIFDLAGKIDIQLASLQLILTEAKIDSKEIEFIDLRFDKPVVRFAPKKHG